MNNTPHYTQDEELKFARLAYHANRYQDLIASISRIAKTNVELSEEEIYLLTTAYTHIVSGLRTSWRIIIDTMRNLNYGSYYVQQVTDLRVSVEKEIESYCNDLITLLDNYVIPFITAPISKVNVYKLKGDYHRYLAELLAGERQNYVSQMAHDAYNGALEFSKELEITHPNRLALALNFFSILL